jgi:hypothetical protein
MSQSMLLSETEITTCPARRLVHAPNPPRGGLCGQFKQLIEQTQTNMYIPVCSERGRLSLSCSSMLAGCEGMLRCRYDACRIVYLTFQLAASGEAAAADGELN